MQPRHRHIKKWHGQVCSTQWDSIDYQVRPSHAGIVSSLIIKHNNNYAKYNIKAGTFIYNYSVQTTKQLCASDDAKLQASSCGSDVRRSVHTNVDVPWRLLIWCRSLVHWSVDNVEHPRMTVVRRQDIVNHFAPTVHSILSLTAKSFQRLLLSLWPPKVRFNYRSELASNVFA